jgi:hypothetical protein
VPNDRPHPEKFEVRILYNGLTRDLEVHAHEKMKVVTDHAIKLFEVTEQPHLLALFDEQNHEFIDLTQTVTEAGLEPGQRLVLRQSQVRGG